MVRTPMKAPLATGSELRVTLILWCPRPMLRFENFDRILKWSGFWGWLCFNAPLLAAAGRLHAVSAARLLLWCGHRLERVRGGVRKDVVDVRRKAIRCCGCRLLLLGVLSPSAFAPLLDRLGGRGFRCVRFRVRGETGKNGERAGRRGGRRNIVCSRG